MNTFVKCRTGTVIKKRLTRKNHFLQEANTNGTVIKKRQTNSKNDFLQEGNTPATQRNEDLAQRATK